MRMAYFSLHSSKSLFLISRPSGRRRLVLQGCFADSAWAANWAVVILQWASTEMHLVSCRRWDISVILVHPVIDLIASFYWRSSWSPTAEETKQGKPRRAMILCIPCKYWLSLLSADF